MSDFWELEEESFDGLLLGGMSQLKGVAKNKDCRAWLGVEGVQGRHRIRYRVGCGGP